jgi:hypothetical protein
MRGKDTGRPETIRKQELAGVRRPQGRIARRRESRRGSAASTATNFRAWCRPAKRCAKDGGPKIDERHAEIGRAATTGEPAMKWYDSLKEVEARVRAMDKPP